MYCYKCQSKIELPNNKIGFRAFCENCLADLHVCKNCKHYMVGKPNDCNVPNIEFVADKEKNNFCEEFEIKTDKKDQFKAKKDVSNRLFKEADEEKENKKFDSFFKD